MYHVQVDIDLTLTVQYTVCRLGEGYQDELTKARASWLLCGKQIAEG